jgi:hypothetical protein
MANEPHDVALSFFARDVGFARQLYENLSKELRVFFYERAQDTVSGREGDEVFRTPFREARLAVVLLRPGYGEKMWTGVEKTAIAEICVKRGYKNLFAVRMEPMTIPEWIPATHIYFDLETFPIEQLLGAIKLKVVELGGRPQPMTAARRAELLKASQLHERKRKELLHTSFGNDSIRKEVQRLFQLVTDKVEETVKPVVKADHGHNDGRFVMADDRCSLVLAWMASGGPGIEYDEFKVFEYKVRMSIPGRQGVIYYLTEGDPRPSKTTSYHLDLAPSGQCAWKDPKGDLIPTEQLAERVLIEFLDLVERVGKEPRKWPGSRLRG